MKKTTLCYIEHEGCYLMMLRDKKENDPNQGKYLGVGGKFLPGETPDECMVREAFEETGYRLQRFEMRGLVHFQSDTWEDEDMYVYTAQLPDCIDASSVPVCDEGTYQWVPIPQVTSLPLWEGDHLFLEKLTAGERDFEMTVRYQGDQLVAWC